MYYAMLENGLLALLLAPHLPELWYFRFELNPDCSYNEPLPVLCISTLFPSILQRASPMQYIKDQKLSFSFSLSWTFLEEDIFSMVFLQQKHLPFLVSYIVVPEFSYDQGDWAIR